MNKFFTYRNEEKNPKPKQCIIIGGGKSIWKGLDLGLMEKIKGKFVITCNYAFQHFDCTIATYVDKDFQDKTWDKLKDFPLQISRSDQTQDTRKNKNVYLFPNNNEYKRGRPFKEGIYYYYLTGIWALSIAIELLQVGEIFLLGYDAKTDEIHVDGKTYLDNNYHGIIQKKQNLNYNIKIDKINTYFEPFHFEKKCRIYNVCPDSNIVVFNKISYEEFFNKLKTEQFKQNYLQKYYRGVIDAQ